MLSSDRAIPADSPRETDERRQFEMLRESEARYRNIFDDATEGIFRTTVTGKCLMANVALAQILGYASAKEVTDAIANAAHQVWVDPEERAHYVQLLEEQGTVRAYHCRFRRKDGTVIWVSLSARAARGSDGHVAFLDGFVVDITESRQKEEMLRLTEARLASAVDMAGLGFSELDFRTHTTHPDQRIRDLFGLPPGEETHGREWWLSHIHPEDLPAVLQMSKDILEGGRDHVGGEYRYLHPLRGLLWFHHRARVLERDASGRPLRLLAVVQEITERKEAEEGLRTSQRRLASGAELAGLGFYDLTRGEDVTYTDERVRNLYGLPSDSTGGSAANLFWLHHVHPDDVPMVAEANRELSEGGRSRVSVEYRYLHPDGRELWIHHLAVVTERDPQGEWRRITGVVRDITEGKRAAQELARQRLHLAHMSRVSTMGQLASSLAHELNQPLGAILRNAEAALLMLQEPSPDMEEVRAILSDICSDDQRCGEVIARLRGLVKPRELELIPLDLCPLAANVIALLRQDAEMRKVRIAMDPCPTLPLVVGDRVQLQQVVLNLLLNAMESLDANPPEKRQVTVRTGCTGETVTLSVCDNGPGIAPRDLAQIFEPFVTTKPNGLGMGLSISRTIVQMHGGHLTVKNNPDDGATFTLCLPVAEGEANKR